MSDKNLGEANGLVRELTIEELDAVSGGSLGSGLNKSVVAVGHAVIAVGLTVTARWLGV
ncbi:MAG TPA: hypothetical protein VI113_11965 [Alphaproteobacteria bacterium]